MSKEYDVIIIGGGAAGLMCAQIAGHRGKKVLLLEHNDRVGKKILISGGGRCNFTNTDTKPENFLSENPHFCKSALARYSPQDFIDLIEKYEIPYFEKKLGQLFCETSAKQITQLLLRECELAGVHILTNCKINSLGAIHASPLRFRIDTSMGAFTSSHLIIASGGLSFPNLGATPFAYEIAEQFKIKVLEVRPGLVPLLWKVQNSKTYGELSGVSLDAVVSFGKKSFRENILFTHKGLSGPAILQISSYWKAGEKIRIHLLPDFNLEDFLLREKNLGNRAEVKNILAQFFPKRFLEIWFDKHRLLSSPIFQTADLELSKIAQTFKNWEIAPAGEEGYTKAEVTCGGIDTNELSSQTMESKKVPGLYFIGECVDVTGWLGGFNFQWAWASANAAATSL